MTLLSSPIHENVALPVTVGPLYNGHILETSEIGP